jgi:hypothetical protein
MVDAKDQPHGWGRVLSYDHDYIIDGHFKNGDQQGVSRWIDDEGKIGLHMN